MPSGGHKPHLPPDRKKSEIAFARLTPAQYRAFRALGDRYWLRKLLDAEVAAHTCKACGTYHGGLPCPPKGVQS